MAVAGKFLYDGQLAAAQADAYVVPADTKVYIKSIICFNTHATNINTVYLYVRRGAGGTSRQICQVPLASKEQLYFNQALVLEATDRVRGYADNANQVDIVIFGVEET